MVARKYVIICDKCNKIGGAFDTWDETIAYKKQHLWASMNIDGKWTELCPECSDTKEEN